MLKAVEEFDVTPPDVLSHCRDVKLLMNHPVPGSLQTGMSDYSSQYAVLEALESPGGGGVEESQVDRSVEKGGPDDRLVDEDLETQ